MPGIHAASLSVNLTGGCNAQCPYCIATATWKTGAHDNSGIEERIPVACRYAAFHGVDTVLITGSGEPLLPKNQRLVLSILDTTRGVGIPTTEVQTNGQVLAENPVYRGALKDHGLNTVAISVSSPDPKQSAALVKISVDYLDLARALADMRFMVRISLNMSEEECLPLVHQGGLAAYADTLRDAGVSQLTLRELGVPSNPLNTPTAATRIQWVRDHALDPAKVQDLHQEVIRNGHPLRRLPYGPMVYDYHGLSVAVATCMTETTDPTMIRSLILQPDGGVYHDWNYRGSRLI